MSDSIPPASPIPGRYRKKPIVIEAVQIDGTEESAQAALEWADPHTPGRTLAARNRETGEWIVVIETLEGVMSADPGDWIVRGVQGEFYPCKPDIFAATYDADPDATHTGPRAEVIVAPHEGGYRARVALLSDGQEFFAHQVSRADADLYDALKDLLPAAASRAADRLES